MAFRMSHTKTVNKIVEEIKKLEKKYIPDNVKSACAKYIREMNEETRLKLQISDAEDKLDELYKKKQRAKYSKIKKIEEKQKSKKKKK